MKISRRAFIGAIAASCAAITLPQSKSKPKPKHKGELRSTWSLEAEKDLRAWHNLEAEDELTRYLAEEINKEIAEEINKEIDEEVLASVKEEVTRLELEKLRNDFVSLDHKFRESRMKMEMKKDLNFLRRGTSC
jgi:uncharacterized membrane protein YheB (UPF0754 family)